MDSSNIYIVRVEKSTRLQWVKSNLQKRQTKAVYFLYKYSQPFQGVIYSKGKEFAPQELPL